MAKPLLFLLTADLRLADTVCPSFEKILGPVEHRGNWHPFGTDYYGEEMEAGLSRRVVSFQKIIHPAFLAEMKGMAERLEGEFRGPRGRRVNIDPGYVDLFKVVLASHKGGGERVALTKTVFAQALLRYEKGTWIPSPACFPDFRQPIYHGDLAAIRRHLKEQPASVPSI